jgi:endonuclease I/methionine-rich copper-binding protein CopC
MFAIHRRALVALAFACSAAGAQAQVSISNVSSVTENFDTLASTGTTGSTLPIGWAFSEVGGTGQATYGVDNGAGNAGNTYSYGPTGDTDRAFGSLMSGSVTPTLGAQLRNDGGTPITSLEVSYTGEQWRLGVNPRTTADGLNFQYSTDASSLSSGSWTDVDALDFTAPILTGVVGALNGNAAANRVVISGTITGINVPPAGTLWVRWVEINASGADDGLALDDLRFGQAVDNPPSLALSVPDDGDTGVAVSSAITLTFNEAVQTAGTWFDITCAGNPQTATVSGSGAVRTLTPDAPLPFASLCAIDLIEANITDVDGPADALVAGGDFSFTTAADLAPTLVSTTPADNATGVAAGATIALNFSEPVGVPATPADWIDVTCTSGARAGNISGSTSSYVFTPTTLFAPGDVCSVTLDATDIVDLDGAPQSLAGNAQFDFTIAPDDLPAVSSTFPIDGAVNVAAGSNLTVVFSEAVTVTATAFTLECPAGSAQVVGASTADQITYTLDPMLDLPADTACVLSIVASQISDVDGTPDNLPANVTIDFITSAGLAGYYSRVDTSSCRALRATLHGVIDDHSAVVYSDSGNDWTPGVPSTYDVWEVLNLADEDPLDPGKVLDIYRNESYTKIAGGTAVYNREHTWPNSHGFNDVDFLDGFPFAPYTDTHMLMVSNSVYNTRRSNRAYATCNPAVTATCEIDVTIFNASSNDGGGPTSYPAGGVPTDHNWVTPGLDGGSGSYEVWDYRRGDVARGMLYMDVRYEGGTNSRNAQRETDLILTDNRAQIVATDNEVFQTVGYSGLLTPLLNWASQDLPTAREGLRNDVVESVQGNRNPFTDHPEWIAIAFASPCNGPVVVAVDDDFSVNQDNQLTAAAPGVLRDDHNAANKNGQGMTASIVVPAANGTATITNAATGAFTYLPAAGFCGSDSFTYQASNGSQTDQGVAYIDVVCTGVSTPPVAVADAFNVAEDSGANSLAVLLNDTDVDGGAKLVQSVTQPVGGVAAVGVGGANVTFTPNANFCASTSFTYALNGGSSTTVSISMTCVNDAPVANDATFGVAEHSVAATAVGQVVATDVDASDVLSYAITGGNTGGAFAISGTGAVTVANAAALDFETTPQFSLVVTVTDNGAPMGNDSATITVNLSNVDEGSAVANDDNATVNEDAVSVAIDVIANDTADPDGGAHAVIGVSTAQHGTVAFTAAGVSYTPTANYCGADSFTYTITGGDTATVSVTVTCIGDAPVTIATLPDREGREGEAIAGFNVAAAFSSDVPLQYSATNLPAGLTLDPATGAVSGTPAAGSSATSPYTVTITADNGTAPAATQIFIFTILPAIVLPDHIFGNGFED